MTLEMSERILSARSNVVLVAFIIIVIAEILIYNKITRGPNLKIQPFYENEPRNEDGALEMASVEPYINTSIVAKDGVWQTVAVAKDKFFVYSAYYDWRHSERMVRVIGATKTFSVVSVWCLLWFNTTNNTNIIKLVKGSVEVMKEHWRLNYSACFVLCPLNGNTSVPHSVTVLSLLDEAPSNRLLVNHANPDLRHQVKPPPDKLGVCVKPLHSTYNNPLQMLEFIELNSLLGMHHITFYNSSISSTINCILNHYISEGRITVLPWKLGIVSKTEIRTEGMFAALNDCLYRSMYKFSYVAFIDMDEIIMPKYNDTIKQLIEWINVKRNSEHAGAYSFLNAFFYLGWPNDTTLSDDPFENRINSISKTKRKAKLWRYNLGTRSKYVCRPELVIEVGNHIISEFVRGSRMLYVLPDTALLNHYRSCESVDCLESTSVIDRTAHRYKERLLKRVKAKWTQLQIQCSLPNFK